jgi:hypothetical protein
MGEFRWLTVEILILFPNTMSHSNLLTVMVPDCFIHDTDGAREDEPK